MHAPIAPPANMRSDTRHILDDFFLLVGQLGHGSSRKVARHNLQCAPLEDCTRLKFTVGGARKALGCRGCEVCTARSSQLAHGACFSPGAAVRLLLDDSFAIPRATAESEQGPRARILAGKGHPTRQ
jgi:hypothetical protein